MSKSKHTPGMSTCKGGFCSLNSCCEKHLALEFLYKKKLAEFKDSLANADKYSDFELEGLFQEWLLANPLSLIKSPSEK